MVPAFICYALTHPYKARPCDRVCGASSSSSSTGRSSLTQLQSPWPLCDSHHALLFPHTATPDLRLSVISECSSSVTNFAQLTFDCLLLLIAVQARWALVPGQMLWVVGVPCGRFASAQAPHCTAPHILELSWPQLSGSVVPQLSQLCVDTFSLGLIHLSDRQPQEYGWASWWPHKGPWPRNTSPWSCHPTGSSSSGLPTRGKQVGRGPQQPQRGMLNVAPVHLHHTFIHRISDSFLLAAVVLLCPPQIHMLKP